MKRQSYNFVSNWVISASPNFVDTLLISGATTRWWPGLEAMTVLDSIAAMPRYRCIWRSQSGYRLVTVLEITDHQPASKIEFRSHGDLEGAGSFELASEDGITTNITIRWDVATTKWWMNLFAPLLKPFFTQNHQALMAAGERGLQNYIQAAR